MHSGWRLVELSALLEDSRTLPAELTLNLAGQWILAEGKQHKKKKPDHRYYFLDPSILQVHSSADVLSSHHQREGNRLGGSSPSNYSTVA